MIIHFFRLVFACFTSCGGFHELAPSSTVTTSDDAAAASGASGASDDGERTDKVDKVV
jgi:hypothetical protein